jgi:hypothetical protein
MSDKPDPVAALTDEQYVAILADANKLWPKHGVNGWQQLVAELAFAAGRASLPVPDVAALIAGLQRIAYYLDLLPDHVYSDDRNHVMHSRSAHTLVTQAAAALQSQADMLAAATANMERFRDAGIAAGARVAELRDSSTKAHVARINAETELVEVKAERDALRKDAERLSWLDRDDIHTSFTVDNAGLPWVVISDKHYKPISSAGNLRDAIDAAIAARKP